MICKWWHPMWKKIHVELEFLRIQFHHFLSQQSVHVELKFLRLEFHHFLLDHTVRKSSLLPTFFLICFYTSSFQITSSVFQIICFFGSASPNSFSASPDLCFISPNSSFGSGFQSDSSILLHRHLQILL